MARLIESVDPARLADSAERVRARIAAAAQEAGRAPDDVELLVAVKYLRAEDLGALAAAGLTLLGENRAQDLEAKADAHPGVFDWHFIGQLQSRKVRALLPRVQLIHSVASDSALAQLGRHAGPDVEVLVEVNVAGEESKSGVAPSELADFIERCPVRVSGLMTMPPPVAAAEANRRHFAAVRELAVRHGLERLSMGTSQDYEVAVSEGATIVRVGSVLFA